MLGDEGSGAYLGKKLLKEVLSMTAPLNIRELFEKKYNYSSVDILSHLYKQEFPSRFLASFTSFISENMNDAYIQGILKTSFIDFFETQVLKYSRHKEVPVFCTGSVAFYFSDILKEVANEKGIQIKNIVQSPIDGLTEYHLVDLEKFTAIKYSSDMEK
jgi:N-acetylglucosamine kinase-like BadF-type ATPase